MSIERAKIGLLMIGAERFRPLGNGTKDGNYEERKALEAKTYLSRFCNFADVVCPATAYSREGAETAAAEFYNQKVDCVVAMFLSWAEDFAWIRFLREVCIGTLEQVTERVRVFAAASHMRAKLRRTNLSLLACCNEAMWATYVDPYNIFCKIGPEIHFLSVAEPVNEIEATPDSTVDALLADLTAHYRVADNVDAEKFRALVRATYAMESIARRANTDLLVLNDIDTVLFANVGLRPGFAPLDPNEKMVIVPEGDIGGGLATYILQHLTGHRANFIEPFYIDHKNGGFVAGHAGPNNYHECPENVIIARDERFAKSQWKHAGTPFAWYTFPAGMKTMLHMSERDGRMKMVCTLVECLPTKHYLASYSHVDFRHPTLSPEELFGRIGEIGVTQHYAIADGDCLDELEALAKLCDFEFHRI